MRLAVYADLKYRRDGDRISSSTAFVSWLDQLAAQFDELVVCGRLDPIPGKALHPLAAPNICFSALPYYGSLRNPFEVLAVALATRSAWRSELSEVDGVLLFGPHPFALLFGYSARRAGIPVVVGVRQDFVRYVRNRSSLYKLPLSLLVAVTLELGHLALGRRSAVVTVGDRMAARYRSKSNAVFETGVSLVHQQDVVTPTEVDDRKWPGRKTILVVGRLDPEKNPFLLLELAGLLREQSRFDGWTITVAGGGSLAARFAERIIAADLSAWIRSAGLLSQADLQSLYLQSTVFLHVSLTEGQPQVLYEAAAYGLPIVATAVGGVPAALDHGRRGLLVPPRNPAAVVEALDRLDRDAALRRSLSQRALIWARSETAEAQTARVARFIQAFFSDSKGPAE